jgi:hypothetical protein
MRVFASIIVLGAIAIGSCFALAPDASAYTCRSTTYGNTTTTNCY